MKSLLTASYVKTYIKDKQQFNTSADTLTELNTQVQKILDESITQTLASGRKTVMAKDVRNALANMERRVIPNGSN